MSVNHHLPNSMAHGDGKRESSFPWCCRSRIYINYGFEFFPFFCPCDESSMLSKHVPLHGNFWVGSYSGEARVLRVYWFFSKFENEAATWCSCSRCSRKGVQMQRCSKTIGSEKFSKLASSYSKVWINGFCALWMPCRWRGFGAWMLKVISIFRGYSEASEDANPWGAGQLGSRFSHLTGSEIGCCKSSFCSSLGWELMDLYC